MLTVLIWLAGIVFASLALYCVVILGLILSGSIVDGEDEDDGHWPQENGMRR